MNAAVLSTLDYSYDLLDRATGIVQTAAGLAPAVALDQQFDEAGNRTVLAATIGTTADFSNDYFYDFLNRLKRVRQKGVAGGSVVAQKRVEYDYNPDHSVRKVERFRDLAGTKLVAATTPGYDGAGRLNSLSHTKGTTTLAAYGWTYYDDGQVNTFSSADGVLTYGYDAADQLTSVTRSGVGLESYDYDDAGNREMAGYTTDTANRLASDGTYDYEYDDEGNARKKLLAGTSTVVEEYTWDYRNRLTKVTFYSGGAVTKTVDYSYDALNHLIGRKVTAGGTTDQRYFVYDGDQMVLVLDQTGAVQNRYLWGAAVDEILADEQVGGELLWTLTDNLGTVRELVNNTSTVRNHIVYDTYGNVLSETAGGARSAIKFTGRYFDTETGLQWNLNRWYDPKTGRWMSQDPIGFEGGDANLYRYVRNDPGNGVDPSGLATTILSSGQSSYNPFNEETVLGPFVTRSEAELAAEQYRLANARHLESSRREVDVKGGFYVVERDRLNIWNFLDVNLYHCGFVVPLNVGGAAGGAARGLWGWGKGLFGRGSAVADDAARAAGKCAEQAESALLGRPPLSVVEENAAKARNYPYGGTPVIRTAATSDASQIARGHAWAKHAHEFPEFSTVDEFAKHIDNVMTRPTASKNLIKGRRAFWHDPTKTVVIRDPKSADLGTAFRPKNGKAYYDNLK